MKPIRRLLSIALTSIVAIGCTSNDESRSNRLRIGIASEPYPPFSQKGPDGQWHGWEIEIGEAVCVAMNEDCEMVEIAWDGLVPALLSAKIDVVMASLSITEERMRTIDFSSKYYESPAVIVAPTGSDISADPSSVEGKVLGVQVATIHANYIEKYYAGVIGDVSTYQSFDQHNQDLVAGRLDAVVGDSIAMQPFLGSRAGQCCEVKAALEDPEIFGTGAGFGLRKGDDDLRAKLSAAIEQIRADGTYDAISQEYFDFDIYGGN